MISDILELRYEVVLLREKAIQKEMDIMSKEKEKEEAKTLYYQIESECKNEQKEKNLLSENLETSKKQIKITDIINDDLEEQINSYNSEISKYTKQIKNLEKRLNIEQERNQELIHTKSDRINRAIIKNEENEVLKMKFKDFKERSKNKILNVENDVENMVNNIEKMEIKMEELFDKNEEINRTSLKKSTKTNQQLQNYYKKFNIDLKRYMIDMKSMIIFLKKTLRNIKTSFDDWKFRMDSIITTQGNVDDEF